MTLKCRREVYDVPFQLKAVPVTFPFVHWKYWEVRTPSILRKSESLIKVFNQFRLKTGSRGDYTWHGSTPQSLSKGYISLIWRMHNSEFRPMYVCQYFQIFWLKLIQMFLFYLREELKVFPKLQLPITWGRINHNVFHSHILCLMFK